MNVQSSTRGKLFTALLVGALVLAPTTAFAVIQGSPELKASATDNQVAPGEATELTVTIANEGELATGSSNPDLNKEVTTARAVEATLENDGAPVQVNTGTHLIGQLPEGKDAPLGFAIAVDEDASPGTYDLELDVEYEYTSTVSENNGGRNTNTETRTFDVEVEVVDRATFEIVDVDTDLRVGSTGTVSVTMENTGSDAATDARVALESQNSDIAFGESSSATRHVGEWESGETRTIEYQATATQGAESQQYAFQATTTFEDSDGVTRQSSPMSLGVQPVAEQRFSVVETESDVAVGDTGTIAVTMVNDGAIPVNDATVNLQSQSSDIVFGESASATRFVGEWAPGETRTMTFDATATGGADTRSYALSATVSYDDESDDPGTAPAVSLGVTPLPETSFALSNVTSDLRVGEERTLEGTITNDGETTTRDVVVTFVTEAENVNPVDRKYAVGDLQPGESADFAFTVEISEGANSGPRQFSFVSEYRNSDGDLRKSDELLTRRNVGEESDAFALDVVDGTVENGGSTTYTVEVTNAGNETVSDVTAKLYANSPISVDDDESFIQSLEPGESAEITFSVGASGALEKRYPLKMDFEYEDEDGDLLVSDTYRAPIDVRNGEGGSSLPLVLVGIAGVAVVGIGGYMRFR